MSSQFEHYSEPAILTVLSGNSDKRNAEVTGAFHGLQGKCLTVETSQRLTGSSPVSVRYEDVLFLGEVVGCSSQTGGAWRVEIRVEQMLSGLMSLLNLRSQLLAEGVAPARSFTPITAMA